MKIWCPINRAFGVMQAVIAQPAFDFHSWCATAGVPHGLAAASLAAAAYYRGECPTAIGIAIHHAAPMALTSLRCQAQREGTSILEAAADAAGAAYEANDLVSFSAIHVALQD